MILVCLGLYLDLAGEEISLLVKSWLSACFCRSKFVFYLSVCANLEKNASSDCVKEFVITSEKSIDLLLELHQLRHIEGISETLSREQHQTLIKIFIWSFICDDLRLELHVAAAFVLSFLIDRLIFVNNTGVTVGHLDCLFIKFFPFWWQNLRFGQLPLQGFLLQHLLFIL